MPSIPRITRSHWSTEYVEARQPCLMIDALAGWPAFERWSPAYIKTACAGCLATVQVSRSGQFHYDAEGAPLDPSTQYALWGVPMETAADWIAERPSGHTYYISQSNIRAYPALVPDLRFELPPEQSATNLWFGSEGTVTPLHYDMSDNWFAQVYGVKTVTLINPAHTDTVYPNGTGSMSHISPVDPSAPDLVKYPRFSEVETCVLTVEPGQMLYLPAFWWHHVRAESTSISTNQWGRLELARCESENATRYWVRAFQRDAWLSYRSRRNLTRLHLLDAARALQHKNAPLAVLALTIVMDELARWPTSIELASRAAIESIVGQLHRMTASVVAGCYAEVDVDRLGDLIELARNIETLETVGARVAPAV